MKKVIDTSKLSLTISDSIINLCSTLDNIKCVCSTKKPVIIVEPNGTDDSYNFKIDYSSHKRSTIVFDLSLDSVIVNNIETKETKVYQTKEFFTIVPLYDVYQDIHIIQYHSKINYVLSFDFDSFAFECISR